MSERYELPAEHVSPKIRKLVEAIAAGERRLLSVEDMRHMRMNSYERQWVLAYMDDKALVERIRHAQQNCRQTSVRIVNLAGTYDEALCHPLMDELLERYTTLQGALAHLGIHI